MYWCDNCQEFHESESPRLKPQPHRKVMKVKVAPPEPKKEPTLPPSVSVTRITKNTCEIRFSNAVKVRNSLMLLSCCDYLCFCFRSVTTGGIWDAMTCLNYSLGGFDRRWQ
jgi:hypothetical protein